MNIIFETYIRCVKYILDIFGEILNLFNWNLYEMNTVNIFKRLTFEEIEHISSDQFFMQGLTIFLSECRQKSGISLTGRIRLTSHIVQTIKMRYKFFKHLEDNPDLEDVEIKDPVFILSFPRTGSTFLHCTLLEDNNWFSPEIWTQILLPGSPTNPLSKEDFKNIDAVQKAIDIRRAVIGSKKIQSAHNVRVRDSEDILLHYDLMGFFLYHTISFENMDKTLEFINNQPFSVKVEKYKLVKKIFQMLKKNYPDQRLLAMAHFPASDAGVLLEIFPDAKFITLHRDPVTSVKSVLSLLAMPRNCFYSYSSSFTPKKIAQLCKYYTTGTKAYLKQRERIERRDGNETRFIDVSFPNLVNNPLSCLKEIYQKVNANWDDKVEEKFKKYISNQKEHSVGKHVYKKNKNEIVDEELKGEFVDYLKRFERYIKQ